ncbi:hypothetical protein [Simkania sp.]|uniref:hypothetical protein n=1 Tax=Simkania sp. TaxID=34094 RepID=UPI003B5190CB
MKTSSLTTAFTRVIDDKRYLGIDESDMEVRGRFQFFTANRRAPNGELYQVERPDRTKQPAYYYCMEDQATNEVYIAHPAESLPKYFVGAGLGAIPMTFGTVAWNIGMIFVTAVCSLFEIFKDIYPTRHDGDVTEGLLDRLKNKVLENYQEVKNRFTWSKTSIEYGVAIGAAALNALMNYNDEQTLFEMKVVIARIEFLWNRKKNFHKSALVQLNNFNTELAARMKKDPDSNRVDVSLELFKEIQWSTFFSVGYIMQCFQSRGSKNDEVFTTERSGLRVDVEHGRVEAPKDHLKRKPVFEVCTGSLKKSYKEYAEYMDKETPSWRVGF